MTNPEIITIGVYGFTESSFFESLVKAKIDTFCDIRMRRGMRGATYSFANSQHLQTRLHELGIRYFHVKELAPNQEVREKQKKSDKQTGDKKRTRKVLSQEFVEAYHVQCLDKFKANEFLEKLGKDAKRIALFCVEKDPTACHRSLVAEKINKEIMLEIKHILP
ncbi:MAG: DUF488 family protein [Chloroflexota bacterium]|nr:DUF488 domain-containing protein [Chloroflexota bacterium]MBI5701958.1 DUF488 domain-containing protein [Chloroflexota bacterium]